MFAGVKDPLAGFEDEIDRFREMEAAILAERGFTEEALDETIGFEVALRVYGFDSQLDPKVTYADFKAACAFPASELQRRYKEAVEADARFAELLAAPSALARRRLTREMPELLDEHPFLSSLEQELLTSGHLQLGYGADKDEALPFLADQDRIARLALFKLAYATVDPEGAQVLLLRRLEPVVARWQQYKGFPVKRMELAWEEELQARSVLFLAQMRHRVFEDD